MAARGRSQLEVGEVRTVSFDERFSRTVAHARVKNAGGVVRRTTGSGWTKEDAEAELRLKARVVAIIVDEVNSQMNLAELMVEWLQETSRMETHTRNASEYVASWQRHEPDAIRKVGETLSKAIKQTIAGASWRNAID